MCLALLSFTRKKDKDHLWLMAYGTVACGLAVTRIYTQGQGAAKNKSVTPVVGGWVRGQKSTRTRFSFLIFFYGFEALLTEKRSKT
jgi:hypothetical protein